MALSGDFREAFVVQSVKMLNVYNHSDRDFRYMEITCRRYRKTDSDKLLVLFDGIRICYDESLVFGQGLHDEEVEVLREHLSERADV